MSPPRPLAGAATAVRRVDKIEANQRLLKRFVMNFSTARLGKS